MSDLTAAIVLAAGGSTRLGRPKQLLEYRGETLIHHAVRTVIDAGCSPTVVVLGAHAEACAGAMHQLQIARVENIDWQRGIGSSIRCGIDALLKREPANRIDRLILSLVDQPHIDAEFIRSLIGHSKKSSRLICAAKFADTIGPPVCIARSEFAAMANLPDDRGAKSLWLKRPDLLATLDCPAAGIDIDTDEDFRRLTR